MSVADYVVALAALALCGLWTAGSFLAASADAFVPAPNEESARLARKGCASLVCSLLGLIYFAGVLVNGSWGWVQ